MLVLLQVQCLELVTPGGGDGGVGADLGLPLSPPPQLLPRPGHQFFQCKHLVQFVFSYLDLTDVHSSGYFPVYFFELSLKVTSSRKLKPSSSMCFQYLTSPLCAVRVEGSGSHRTSGLLRLRFCSA